MTKYSFIAILVVSLGFRQSSGEEVFAYTDEKARMIESSGRLPIWPVGGPLEENGLSGPERLNPDAGWTNVHRAELFIDTPKEYFERRGMPLRTAVVIAPGGAFEAVRTESEGRQIARYLKTLGIAAFVVKYRLPNQRPQIPAADVRRAIKIVRHNAKEWGVDPTKVGVWGCSAGGHVACSVSTNFDNGRLDSQELVERQSSRPDFSILFYPVVTMEEGVTHAASRQNLLGPNPEGKLIERFSNDLNVDNNTPPTFILHASDDNIVPVENSLRYYKQLVAQSIPCQILTFEAGGHGPLAFKSNPAWQRVFKDWISRR